MNDNLPVPRPAVDAPAAGFAVPPRMAYHAAADLEMARAAVSTGSADVAVTLQVAVVCSGDTAADALQAAADMARKSPLARLHQVGYAMVPGPAEGLWEHRLTLIISYPDERGEYTGDTHQAGPRPRPNRHPEA